MEVIRLLLGMSVVFGLLALMKWVLRTSTKGDQKIFKFLQLKNIRLTGATGDGPRSALSVANRIALTPSHSIHLVNYNSSQLLICTHPQGCTVLRSGETGAIDFARELKEAYGPQLAN